MHSAPYADKVNGFYCSQDMRNIHGKNKTVAAPREKDMTTPLTKNEADILRTLAKLSDENNPEEDEAKIVQAIANIAAPKSIETAPPNREAWLCDAANMLYDRILEPKGYTLNGNTGEPLLIKLHVTVSWPTHRALSKRRNIGQCIPSAMSVDGRTEILISPWIGKGIAYTEPDGTYRHGALETLIHEMGHATCGSAAAHNAPFAKYCKDIGLEGIPTSTRASASLNKIFEDIEDELGPYPHESIDITVMPKQTTRMIKVVCPDDDCPAKLETGSPYTVRMSAKWIEKGMPYCGICQEVMVVPEEGGEGGIASPFGPSDPDEDEEDGGYEGDYDPNSDEGEAPDPYAGDEPGADEDEPGEDGPVIQIVGDEKSGPMKITRNPDATNIQSPHIVDPNCNAGENGGMCNICKGMMDKLTNPPRKISPARNRKN